MSLATTKGVDGASADGGVLFLQSMQCYTNACLRQVQYLTP